MDEVEEVCISDSDPARVIQVGKNLPGDIRAAIIAQVEENQDLLAWSHSDMTGIDRNIICHALSIDPNATPVRQKRRPLGTERAEALKLEVEKLSSINFIREAVYPVWLANPVLVPKPNGTWRTCIDFTDLNKACPKDCFPLPRIDQMVDATSGYEILSFMDAYLGYNQISMHVADQEHTSFQTDKGIYCYVVMPFGLKNAGATYQRLVNRMFRAQLGRNMEVYIDDMLVKSKTSREHSNDLAEAFAVIRKYGMKLNPKKCTFGVASGKFLGFIVCS